MGPQPGCFFQHAADLDLAGVPCDTARQALDIPAVRLRLQFSALSPLQRFGGGLLVLLAIVLPQVMLFKARQRATQEEAEALRQANAQSLKLQKQVRAVPYSRSWDWSWTSIHAHVHIHW